LEVLALGVLASISSHTLAKDALTFPLGAGSDTTALFPGGCGWSFVPTANIVVTSVGYLDVDGSGGDASVVVTLWSGTQTVLASYTGIDGPLAEPNTLISAAVPPLVLTAGRSYSITVQTGPLSSSFTSFALHDNSGTLTQNPFGVAPELGQYQGIQLSQSGVFAPLSSDPAENQQLLWFGPTFTYEIVVPHPVLIIATVGNNNVRLSWPTNAVGFSLQCSPSLNGMFSAITNTPSVSGTNFLTTLPSTKPATFFRLAKPN
jgi:hypothetical protein